MKNIKKKFIKVIINLLLTVNPAPHKIQLHVKHSSITTTTTTTTTKETNLIIN